MVNKGIRNDHVLSVPFSITMNKKERSLLSFLGKMMSTTFLPFHPMFPSLVDSKYNQPATYHPPPHLKPKMWQTIAPRPRLFPYDPFQFIDQNKKATKNKQNFCTLRIFACRRSGPNEYDIHNILCLLSEVFRDVSPLPPLLCYTESWMCP